MASPSVRRWRWRILGGVVAVALLVLALRAFLGPKVPVWVVERPAGAAGGGERQGARPGADPAGERGGGRVVRVRVEEGERVKAGELLMQLDDAEAQAAVAQARRRWPRPRPGSAGERGLGAGDLQGVRQAELGLAQAEVKRARSRTLAEAAPSAGRTSTTPSRPRAGASQQAGAAQAASTAATGADAASRGGARAGPRHPGGRRGAPRQPRASAPPRPGWSPP